MQTCLQMPAKGYHCAKAAHKPIGASPKSTEGSTTLPLLHGTSREATCSVKSQVPAGISTNNCTLQHVVHSSCFGVEHGWQVLLLVCQPPAEHTFLCSKPPTPQTLSCTYRHVLMIRQLETTHSSARKSHKMSAAFEMTLLC